MTTSLTLGPVLFNWPGERWRDFYFRIADEAPVDFVCVGEIVCSKRSPYFEEYMQPVIERLERAGKAVVISTLIMPTLDRERRQIVEIAETAGGLVEANDMAALKHLAGRPHCIGPTVNVYNEATLSWLAQRGAVRVCLPPELPQTSIKTIAAARGATEIEVLGFGRLPLAISARCYHARAHGLAKDSCQFVCERDQDGMDVTTLDGQPFLAINGVQTLSDGYANLIEDLPALVTAGVTGIRLSPHSVDMVGVARLFRDALDGRRDPASATAALRALAPQASFIDGYMHGVEGAKWLGAGAAAH